MKLALASALPLLAAAFPASNSNSQPEQPAAFTVMAARSASPIHFLQLNAAGQSFWLGGEPSTYCPLPSGCPPGNTTVFAGNGASLSVVVPGGQQVYVAPSGALKFTQAHSANIPPGSSLGPFEVDAPAEGSAFGYYSYTGWGTDGFMACPTDDNRWQVFGALQNATVPSGDVNDCLGFSALAIPTNQTGQTWQYI
ncbi:putative IgE binding protein [Aspergillus undulatus]|uniref:putative IgE binding protein n=1 Tax=Aspergillus undulatus TaxID=1810928 RepID=UPI003CCCC8F7